MKTTPFILLFFLPVFLYSPLTAQQIEADSVYIGANWQKAEKAVYRMVETHQDTEEGAVPKPKSKEYLVSFYIAEKTAEDYLVRFKFDSLLPSTSNLRSDEKLLDTLLTQLTYEYLAENFGAFRQLTNEEDIKNIAKSFLQKKTQQTAGDEKVSPEMIFLLKTMFSSTEQIELQLLDFIEDLCYPFGYTFPLGKENYWQEESRGIIPQAVKFCDLISDLDTVKQTIRYRFKSVSGSLEANASILHPEKKDSTDLKKEPSKEKNALGIARSEYLNTGDMTIHYPSGWVLESKWERTVYQNSQGKRWATISTTYFKLLELETK